MIPSVKHLRHQGVVLINTRINFENGKCPPPHRRGSGVDEWRGYHEDWTVMRHQPRQPIWARSKHKAGTKVHQIAYQLTATHKGGTQVTITRWVCGARCMSEIEIKGDPVAGRIPLRQRCWTCSKPKKGDSHDL